MLPYYCYNCTKPWGKNILKTLELRQAALASFGPSGFVESFRIRSSCRWREQSLFFVRQYPASRWARSADESTLKSENTHCRGKEHCTAGFQFNNFFLWAILSFFYFTFGLFQALQILQQINVKNSILYTVLGFELMAFRTWVSSHNH